MKKVFKTAVLLAALLTAFSSVSCQSEPEETEAATETAETTENK